MPRQVVKKGPLRLDLSGTIQADGTLRLQSPAYPDMLSLRSIALSGTMSSGTCDLNLGTYAGGSSYDSTSVQPWGDHWTPSGGDSYLPVGDAVILAFTGCTVGATAFARITADRVAIVGSEPL